MPKDKTPPTLTSPASIPVGSSITVTGANFGPGEQVLLGDSHAGQYVTADAGGGFTHDMVYLYTGPGNAGVAAYVQNRRNWEWVASTTFEVVA